LPPLGGFSMHVQVGGDPGQTHAGGSAYPLWLGAPWDRPDGARERETSEFTSWTCCLCDLTSDKWKKINWMETKRARK